MLILEETWLFSNQFNVISKYFQECEPVNICGINEDIYCQGRSYGGCSIVYSNNNNKKKKNLYSYSKYTNINYNSLYITR